MGKILKSMIKDKLQIGNMFFESSVKCKINQYLFKYN